MESRLQARAKECSAAAAIARARALQGDSRSCCVPRMATSIQVPTESTFLSGKVADCSGYIGPPPTPPSSVFTNNIQRQVLDAYANPTDPARRFLEYQGLFLA